MVIAVLVPDSEIANVDHSSFEIDPEFSGIPFAGSEIVEDLLDFVDALFGVAGLDTSSNDGFAAWEDASTGFAVKANGVLVVDKGDVNRQTVENAFNYRVC